MSLASGAAERFTPARPRASVLVVDDESRVRTALRRMLSLHGFSTTEACDGLTAIETARRTSFDLAITDLNMPGITGEQTLAALVEIDAEMPVLILTADCNPRRATWCFDHGAYDYLEKPFDSADFGLVVLRALERRKLHQEARLASASKSLFTTLGQDDLIGVIMALLPGVVSASSRLVWLTAEDEGSPPLLHRGGAPLSDAMWQTLAAAAPDAAPPPGLVDVLTFPLAVRDHTLGSAVLVREAGQPGFTQLEAQRASLFCAQAALALDNTRVVQRLAHAEKAARASGSLLQAVVDAAPDAVLVLKPDATIATVNRATERMFHLGAPMLLGRRFEDVALPPSSCEGWREWLAELASPRGTEATEMTAVRSGESFPIHVSGAAVETGSGPLPCVFLRDLSHSKAMELELRHAQKLEAVGRLAAGIAHEINTPIQFVGDSAHFLDEAWAGLTRLLEAHEELRIAARGCEGLRGLVDKIDAAREAADFEYVVDQIPRAVARTLEGVSRVATIVRAMKEFAHPDVREKRSADLNRAIESTLTVARNELKYVADVETDFGELPAVHCHLSDLNQVFLNLFINAAHAISDVIKPGERGRIGVRTREEGGFAVVEISDSGSGIPEAIQGRIFDPFFTTKEVGRGTGQGLAIARHVVVDKHGGTMTFATEVGHGTKFTIRLPIGSDADREDVA